MLCHFRLLALLLFLSLAASSQKISGVIKDTALNKPMHNASVSVLRKSDSTLLAFTRAKTNGEFAINYTGNIPVFLLITYPKYADFTQQIIPGDTTAFDVSMITQAVLLEEVIVRGTAAIKMRGDTLSFTADSFKLQQGATVEDLLRRLPGLSVDANGQITAQGQKVQKVLVDGDEFFGDDPTLATRNLQATAVKEVQVFDKKSDQAQFTGVSDGNEQKTINLKLKDEFKKGYFGKVKGGAGLPERYETQNMLNAFRDKRKFSVYGIAANTNNTSLNWSEENQFGGNISSEMTVMDDGGIMITSDGDEFGGVGGFYGEGVPTSLQLGTSYANKWNGDRSKLNAAGRFQQMTTDARGEKRTQYQLPDTQFFQNEASTRFADRWQTRVNTKADLFIDSANMLIVSMRGSFGKAATEETFTSQTLSPKSEFINQSNRRTTNNTESSNAQLGLTWNKKFKTLRRTFSLNLNYGYNNSSSDGFLFTTNSFASSNSEIIDQRKLFSYNKNEFSSRAAYTEPFGKNGTVEFSYGLSQNINSQERLSYDRAGNSYTDLNEKFSNSFDFNNQTHRGGLNYTYVKDKLRAGFGSDVAFNQWKQDDLFKDTTRNYNFTNVFPKANFRYKLGTYSNISFEYRANTQAPSLNQLQPVADNTDPLNLIVGNPDLKISFRQTFRVSYNFYQVIKSRGMWVSMNYNPVSNAFSSSNIVDASGRRVQQSVNVDGNYDFSLFGGYNANFKENKAGINLFVSPRLRRFTNYINGAENITRSNGYELQSSLWLRKDKKYYIQNSASVTYNTSTSSVRPDQNIRYFTGELSADINYELPLRFFITTNVNYQWRQKTDQFPDNNNMFLWNFTLENKVSKKQDMRIGFRINDVLNNRFGFDRNVTSNFISERTWNVVSRYWLVTFSWSFNKGPQKVEQDFQF